MAATPSTILWPRLLTPKHLAQLILQQKNPHTALHLFNTAPLLYPSTYTHTTPVYSAIIHSLTSPTLLLPQLQSVLHQFIHTSSPARDSLFASAIRSLHKSNHPHHALSLYNQIPLSNCSSYPLSFHSILHVLFKQKDYETALKIFNETPHKTSIRSLNLIINSLCQLGRSDLALNVFAELQELCCNPNRETYRILMKGLCDSGKLEDGKHLLYAMLRRITKKGCEEDVVVYRTLLEALCAEGRVGEARDILGKVLLKGIRSPRGRRSFRKPELGGFDLEEIRRKVDEALVVGGVRSLKSYRAVILDLYAEGKFGNAERIFDEMVRKGFRPTVSMYGAKIKALCREGRAEDGVRVLEVEMKERDCVPMVKTYNLVMEGLCKEGKSMRGVEYLERMEKQVGCVARKKTFEILLDGLLSEGRFVEAASVLERMARRRFWPGSEIYSRMIEGLCSIGRRYEAVLWLEEMVSQGKMPEPFLWKSLVSLVCLDREQVEIFSFVDVVCNAESMVI